MTNGNDIDNEDNLREPAARLLFEASGHDLHTAIEALLEAAAGHRQREAKAKALDEKAAEFITDTDACNAFNAVVWHFGGERLYDLAEELIKAQDGD